MEKLIKMIPVVSVVLLSFADGFAAGIELTAIGARATSMGGNYRAIADDWSAMYWNPAGLVHAEGWNIGVNLGYIMPRASFLVGSSHYYDTYGDADYQEFSAAYRSERPAERKNHIAPSAGISYNSGRMAFGVGLWVPMGWSAKWDLLQTASDEPADAYGGLYSEYNAAYPKFEYESRIQFVDIHPAFSYRLTEKLSIGVGASIVLGEIWIRQPAFLQNPYLYDRTMYRTLQDLEACGDVTLLNQMRRPPFDHLINEAEMKSTGTAFGANAGIMYKPAREISFGLSVQVYSDFTASGDYRQTAYFGDAPLYQEQAELFDEALYARLYENNLLDDQQYQILTEFYSGKVLPLVRDEAELILPLPMKAGIGVSYSGFGRLLLAMDFNYSRWSVWDVFIIKSLEGATLSELAFNWSDTYKLGFGFEYPLGNTAIRAGFSAENRATPNESVSPTIPDIGDRYTLNLGIARPIGPLQLALNFERIFIGETDITTWIYNDLTLAQNVAGIYKVNANTLTLGLDYSF